MMGIFNVKLHAEVDLSHVEHGFNLMNVLRQFLRLFVSWQGDLVIHHGTVRFNGFLEQDAIDKVARC